MQATATRNLRERREDGARRPPVPALLACAAIVLATVLAIADSAPPRQRREASQAAAALAPPRAAAGRLSHRLAALTSVEKPQIHRATDPSPRPCSPSLYSAPDMETNEGTTNSSLPLRPGLRLRAVMLFVDFPDLRATESTSALYQRLVPRARRWFEEVSYGRLELEVTRTRRWFRMPEPVRSYGLADGVSALEQHR